MAQISSHGVLKAEPIAAAESLRRQLHVGDQLLARNDDSDSAVDRLLAAIFDWHVINRSILQSIFGEAVADDYAARTPTPTINPLDAWIGKKATARQLLVDRCDRLRILALLYGLPIEAPDSSHMTVAAEPFSNAIFATALQTQIEKALHGIAPELDLSYRQVRKDLADQERISWAGTAHEIREILAHILRALAPDEDIKAQPSYKPEPGTTGPTQRQRVEYILARRQAIGKETQVLQLASSFESVLGDIVRGTYTRASAAAHTFKGRTEAQRLLAYFEAILQDLLNV